MDMIEILDRYIMGNFQEGSQLFEENLLDVIANEPQKEVHRLLVHFKEKALCFEPIEPLEDLESAHKALIASSIESEKYLTALFILKYQNPVASEFVNMVLARVGV